MQESYFVNVKSTLKLKQRWFRAGTKIKCHGAQEMIIFLLTLKRCVFQRLNNIVLSTLNQHQNFTLKPHWFWVDPKSIFVLMLQCLRNSNLYIKVEMITVKQRRNNDILSALKQRRNWCQTTMILGWHQNQFCSFVILKGQSTSNKCWNYIYTSISTNLRIILTCFFDLISIGEWSTSFWCIFLV